MAFRINVSAIRKAVGIGKHALSDAALTPILKDATVKVYHSIIYGTPQYSGYLASNLRVEVKGKGGEGVATELADAHANWKDIKDPKKKGDDHAIGIAASYNRWFNDHQLTISDKIVIRFVVPTYGATSGTMKLRDVNQPAIVMAKAEDMFSKFSYRLGWTRTHTNEMI
jgi:hypothetical protein